VGVAQAVTFSAKQDRTDNFRMFIAAPIFDSSFC